METYVIILGMFFVLTMWLKLDRWYQRKQTYKIYKEWNQ